MGVDAAKSILPVFQDQSGPSPPSMPPAILVLSLGAPEDDKGGNAGIILEGEDVRFLESEFGDGRPDLAPLRRLNVGPKATTSVGHSHTDGGNCALDVTASA